MRKQEAKHRRRRRTRAKIFGMAHRPRLCVFRSLKHIYGQLIDDEKGKVLLAVSDRELKGLIKNRKTAITKAQKRRRTLKKSSESQEDSVLQRLQGKRFIAYEVGKLLAQKALRKKITKVIFDRGPYKYHGRIKALAEGAREGGLQL